MLCSLCLQIFQDPVFACGNPCQHVFCRTCIEQALKASSASRSDFSRRRVGFDRSGWRAEEQGLCPTCRKAMSPRSLQRHQQIKNLVDELPVNCPCRCGWQKPYDQRNEHLRVCPVAKIKKEITHLDDEAKANRRRKEEWDHRIQALQKGLALAQKASRQLDKDHDQTIRERSGETQARWEELQKEHPEAVKRPLTREESAFVPDPPAKHQRVGSPPCEDPLWLERLRTAFPETVFGEEQSPTEIPSPTSPVIR